MSPRNIECVSEIKEEEKLKENFNDLAQPITSYDTTTKNPPPMQLVWRNIFWMVYLHVAAFYGVYLLPKVNKLSMLWTLALYYFSCLGITAGCHRLWSHRSYKAKLPLRIFLASLQTLAFQNSIIEWCRDHRVHHKYSETHADPHNATRGFFFAHCGWLMVRKHPDVKAKGKLLDLSDLRADPVCAFQQKYYLPLVFAACFVFPAAVPWYFWSESLWNAFFVCSLMRYVICLHVTWLVNSLAHMWGVRPYDSNINPVENFFVTFGAIGEGFHNYHHTFPYDYATSEFGWKINLTTLFIDAMASIGQAWDCKKVSQEMIDRRRNRTGDGTKSGFGLIKSR